MQTKKERMSSGELVYFKHGSYQGTVLDSGRIQLNGSLFLLPAEWLHESSAPGVFFFATSGFVVCGYRGGTWLLRKEGSDKACYVECSFLCATERVNGLEVGRNIYSPSNRWQGVRKILALCCDMFLLENASKDGTENEWFFWCATNPVIYESEEKEETQPAESWRMWLNASLEYIGKSDWKTIHFVATQVGGDLIKADVVIRAEKGDPSKLVPFLDSYMSLENAVPVHLLIETEGSTWIFKSEFSVVPAASVI